METGKALVVSTSPDMQGLGKMLMTRRPAGSKTERQFIKQWIAPLGVQGDKRGNLIKRIGDAPVLWSCHTDTVHRQGGTQDLLLDKGILTLAKDSDSNCLGADDTAGVWLMREMILARVPGLYIFHRAEERGGVGSRYIAFQTPKLLKNIHYAIALDRKGKDSVITFQSGGRCCSESFATELGKRLGSYKPDDTGLFTDTANYTKLIPECTNISVGYRNEHWKTEELNVEHLVALRKSLIQLNLDGLPAVRDPSKHEPKYSKWGSYAGYGWKSPSTHKHHITGTGSYGRPYGDDYGSPMMDGGYEAGYKHHGYGTEADEGCPFDVEEMIKNNPEAVVKMLKSYGWGEAEIMADLYQHGAILRGSWGE